MPIDENVCDLKMNALTEKIGLMIQPITDGIKRIEGDVKALSASSAQFVLRRDFDDKCREIEDIKRFVWRVSGGLSIAAFILGLAVKYLK